MNTKGMSKEAIEYARARELRIRSQNQSCPVCPYCLEDHWLSPTQRKKGVEDIMVCKGCGKKFTAYQSTVYSTESYEEE